MAKQSPLQIVKARFESKAKLASQLAGMLESGEDESAEAFEARLAGISNKKLLRLHAAATRLKNDFGGKEALVDAIVNLKFGKANADYKAKLMTHNLTRLLDLHGSLKKKAN